METAKLLPLAFEPQDTKSVAVYLQGLLTQQGHFRQGVKMKPPPDRQAQPKRYDPDTLPVVNSREKVEGAYGKNEKN